MIKNEKYKLIFILFTVVMQGFENEYLNETTSWVIEQYYQSGD
jgi:hypothetical protein